MVSFRLRLRVRVRFCCQNLKSKLSRDCRNARTLVHTIGENYWCYFRKRCVSIPVLEREAKAVASEKRDERERDYQRCPIRPVLEMAIFATYKWQQTMLERQKRLNFLPEMQSKVSTNCNNSCGTEYKTGFCGYILKKKNANAQKFF